MQLGEFLAISSPNNRHKIFLSGQYSGIDCLPYDLSLLDFKARSHTSHNVSSPHVALMTVDSCTPTHAAICTLFTSHIAHLSH